MSRPISLQTVADLAEVFDPITLAAMERDADALADRDDTHGWAWRRMAEVFADAAALADFRRSGRGRA